MESVENISTATDDDDLVSLRLVLTPTQDSQGLGQPGISSPPVLPLTPAAAPNTRTPILQGGGPVVAPGPVRDPQPRALVQLGGAGATPRRDALQAAAQQGAGFADRHPVPHHLPPSPQAEVHPNASPSQNLHPPAADPPSQPTQDLPPVDSLPTLETVHGTFVPTVTWVPKPARAEFARVFASQCNRVVYNPDNISAWILQLMFAKCILPAVKSRPDITQARAVRDRLARWRAGEYAALWREAVDMTRKRGKQTRKNQRQEQQCLEVKNAQRSRRLAQEGKYTRAVQALTSAGLADHTPATIRAMRDKHPRAQPSNFQSTKINVRCSAVCCMYWVPSTETYCEEAQKVTHGLFVKNAIK